MIIALFLIRFFDIIFSSLAIVIMFPFMLPIMLTLKLTGEHDIFYRQKRVGKYGKEFSLIKFATMLRDSSNMPGGYCTLKDDPRLLPMGGFLRKTKINELPQLINIIRGQMSIVGYRPLLRCHYDHYSNKTKQALHNIRPGLSSIGSIIFRDEEKILQSIADIENRVRFYNNVIMPFKGELECWFVDRYNILNYFKIIIFTFVCVVNPNTNISKKMFSDLPEPPIELTSFYVNRKGANDN